MKVLLAVVGSHAGTLVTTRNQSAAGHASPFLLPDLLWHVIERMESSESWRLAVVSKAVFNRLACRPDGRYQLVVEKLSKLNAKIASRSGWSAVVRYCMPEYAREIEDSKRADAMRIALRIFSHPFPWDVPLAFYRIEQLLATTYECRRQAVAFGLMKDAWAFSPEWGERVVWEIGGRLPAMGRAQVDGEPLYTLLVAIWQEQKQEYRPHVARTLGRLVQVWARQMERQRYKLEEIESGWLSFLTLLPRYPEVVEKPFAAGLLLSARILDRTYKTVETKRFQNQFHMHLRDDVSEEDCAYIRLDGRWGVRRTEEEKTLRQRDAQVRERQFCEKLEKRHARWSRPAAMAGN